MLRLQTSSTNTVKKSLLSIVAFFAFLFGITASAHALTITPARIEIAGDPGATVGGEFTLINEQSTAQTFYASYENFSAQGETGTPAFSAEKTGLDTWLSSQQQVTLEPGKAMKIPYSIAIPAGTEPGGYFAALFWSTTPPSTATGQVSIGAKVGVLILLRVNGDITEKGGITQFTRDGHGFFYSSLPVTMRYKFRNEGADRVEPSGTVTIRDTVYLPAAHLDANAEIGNILPGSIRQFSLQWLKHESPEAVQGFFNTVQYQWQNFALGLYSAHLDLVYGAQQQHATSTLWFFVFPWQLVLCLVIAITIIWRGGKALLVRYNRYIIRKAQTLSAPRDVDLP